jgi:hypothetical protein
MDMSRLAFKNTLEQRTHKKNELKIYWKTFPTTMIRSSKKTPQNEQHINKKFNRQFNQPL